LFKEFFQFSKHPPLFVSKYFLNCGIKCWNILWSESYFAVYSFSEFGSIRLFYEHKISCFNIWLGKNLYRKCMHFKCVTDFYWFRQVLMAINSSVGHVFYENFDCVWTLCKHLFLQKLYSLFLLNCVCFPKGHQLFESTLVVERLG